MKSHPRHRILGVAQRAVPQRSDHTAGERRHTTAARDGTIGTLTLANSGTGTSWDTDDAHGSVSDVQAWNGIALTEDQVAAMANLQPASAPYTFAGVADSNGDGHPDLTVRDGSGYLWLCPRTATGFSPRVAIGHSW